MDILTDIPDEICGLSYQDIADEINSAYQNYNPALFGSFDTRQRQKTREDIIYHLKYLNSALMYRTPGLFDDYSLWLKGLFLGLGLPAEWISDSFQIMREVLLKYSSADEAGRIERYIDQALTRIREESISNTGYVHSDNAYGVQALAYLDAVLHHDRNVAKGIIDFLLISGTPIKEIYLNIFQPVQFEIGRLWQINQISVATEHYATAITQMIMGTLYPHIFISGDRTHTVIAACTSGELHEIGLRMVADLMEIEGWNTRFLGASTPLSGTIQYMRENPADLVALSATISYHLPRLIQIIDAIRSDPDLSSVKILVGGYPFRNNPDLWQKVGADAMAYDAEDAVRKASLLVPI